MAIAVTSTFTDAFVILGAAGLVIPAFATLRLNPVVGFILIGMLVGPQGLGGLTADVAWLQWLTISDPPTVALFGEIGIVLLMFTIGLELSFQRLHAMRKLVFGLGPLQVLISAAAIAVALALVTAANWGQSLIVGLALSLSSTAIVLPILTAEKSLGKGPGRASFAILLFQDLALIPLLLGLSIVSGGLGTGHLLPFALKGIAAITGLLLAGRFLLRPALRRAARTKSPEMFLAATLLIVIGSAAITAAAGLSLVVGALLAGLIVADTEFSRQVDATIAPFKGLLLGVFLISVGIGLDLRRLADDPLIYLAATFALVALKSGLVWPLMQLFTRRRARMARAALMLGPSGEMSLIVLAAAASANLLPTDISAPAQLVTALGMTVLPLLSRLGSAYESRRLHAGPHDIPAAPETRRVVLVGYGRVGRLVGGMLERHGVPYLAIDTDADEVARHRLQGRAVHFGDAGNIELIRHLDLGRARALVVTMDNPDLAARVVQLARADHPDLQIIARARDARHAAELYRAGVSDAVPETIESSLQLSEAVLVDIGVPMGPVIASIHEKRAELRSQIQALVPGLDAPPTLGRRRLRDAVRPS